MSSILHQMYEHSISVDHARYATSIVGKYLDTATVKTSKIFYKTTFPSEIIFARADASTSDEQVEKLSRDFDIHHRYCNGSLIDFLSNKVDLSFAVHKCKFFI